MASYKAQAFLAPKYMTGDGDGYTYIDTATVPALAVGDTVEYAIPAGAEVHTLQFDSTDLDSNGTPLLTFKCGYRSNAIDPKLATNDSYFGTGLTIGRSAGRVGPLSHKPIVFDEDVVVFLTVTAAAGTAAAGTITGIVSANCLGAK